MEPKFRILFAILGCFGMAIVYGFKVNLSVAIVAMVNQTALHEDNSHDSGHHVTSVNDSSPMVVDDLVCQAPETDEQKTNAPPNEDGPLLWSEPEQGLVLGSYFWGYLITQIPGGRIAEIYGGKWVFWGAVILNIAATLLSPICSKAGFQYLIIMRILKGLGAGVTFPAMNVLIAQWSPSTERSTMSAIIYGGTSLGTVLSIPSAGIIAGSLGWEAVFYIHGGLATIWVVLWAILVTDTPDENRFMSDKEKQYISDSKNNVDPNAPKDPHCVESKKGGGPVPWKSILTSVPFWALCLSHALNNFGWYMLLVELPLFMRTGLGFNIKDNALLSALPFLANWLFSIFYSRTLDYLVSIKVMKTVQVRKISMVIASLVPGGCLIGVCFSGCNATVVVGLMIVATCFYGTMFAGVFSNHTDIASNYAGLLMGITNMAATIPGFAVPALVGGLTHGVPGLGPWHKVFYITAGLLGLEFLAFTFFASAEEQEWNKPPKKGLTEDSEKQEELANLSK